MEIRTKFDIGEKVYFFDAGRNKTEKGEVFSIGVYINRKGEKEIGYYIKESESKPPERFSENMVFKHKGDVFDLYMKITNNI